MIDSVIKTWKTSRDLYLEYFDKYSATQLNHIPPGFNNNLVWNIGHVIVAQQSLVYRTSGLEGYLPAGMFDRYKPGTKPESPVTQAEMEELKELLTSLVDRTIEDFFGGKFVVFNERMTGTGFHLGSLYEAIEFNNYHEGLHLGFMMSIRKFV